MVLLDKVIVLLGIVNLLRLSILTLLTIIYDSFLTQSKIKKPALEKYNKNGRISHYKYRPLVSVVIAAYNEEKVIYRTLEALFQSSYKKIQVVVINDGSKDSTEKVISDFIRNNPDKHVSYVYQSNQGKAHALNNGIKNYVKGKIIMCLDADSVLMSESIEKALRYFRN
ncbi:MAG: glycosyltransferase family 2 protein [Candidatus Magasanikiibacteriota bacterium]